MLIYLKEKQKKNNFNMEKNSSDIIVNFSDVTKQYGDLVVLDKLNLEIKKNEMVSIIGPSGSGKTTVLRVLMTLEKINQGVIHLDNEPLTHMEAVSYTHLTLPTILLV